MPDFKRQDLTYKRHHTDAFDYFVYAQVWPESVCVQGNATHRYRCRLRHNVTTWTVHGLWPTKIGSHHGPNFCNQSDPFRPQEIAPLKAQLLEYWPNLHTDLSPSSLWEHE